jgi:hypothetical protein
MQSTQSNTQYASGLAAQEGFPPLLKLRGQAQANFVVEANLAVEITKGQRVH